MRPILEIADFRLSRADGWSVGLPRLQLRAGEVAALHGPSGCGKTSLLLGLFGLQPGAAFRGEGLVAVAGSEWRALAPAQQRQHCRNTLAFVLQDAHAALDPLQTIGQQIAQATGQERVRGVAALQEMGVADAEGLSRRLPHAISGGQAQRVLLAVAWMRRPKLLLADEPSASLDGGSFADLLQRLQLLRQKTGTAVLLATHDQRLLTGLGASVYECKDGQFVPGSSQPVAWPRRQQAAATGTAAILRASGLVVNHGAHRVLDGVDFELCRGEVVALVGESGAGKTTLARALAGHLRPDRGTIELPSRRASVQLLFQDALSSMTPGRTVASLLDETHTVFFDVASMAAKVGLDGGQLAREASALSGGERRRAALLRALSVNPEVLILDEPTASLDRDTAISVMRALLELQAQRGIAMLLITHDESLATTVADRVVHLAGGRLC